MLNLVAEVAPVGRGWVSEGNARDKVADEKTGGSSFGR
jgi:hypothetical protein